MYLLDHEPAHVHVKSAEGEAIFYLNCPEGPASLRKNFGLYATEANHVRRLVQTHIKLLCSAWEQLHEG